MKAHGSEARRGRIDLSAVKRVALRIAKLLLCLLLAAAIALSVLYIRDRIGAMPFGELTSDDIEKITLLKSYNNENDIDLEKEECSELLYYLKCLRVGLPSIPWLIDDFFGIPYSVYRVYLKSGGYYTISVCGYGLQNDSDPRSYICYIQINGIIYNCYDAVLIRDLEQFSIKQINSAAEEIPD